MTEKRKRLEEKKKQVAKKLPPLTEVLRGTFMPWYGVCKNPRCRCHTDRKTLHGPYYRVTYSKGGKTHHAYVGLADRQRVRRQVNNYGKIWKGIEQISALNLRLLRMKK